MNFISEDAKLAVKRGINWLDENHPNWVEDINLDTFDMADCEHCVIGQAVGSYNSVTSQASGAISFKETANWSVNHGFESPSVLMGFNPELNPDLNPNMGRPSYGYKEIEILWTEEVKLRLGEN